MKQLNQTQVFVAAFVLVLAIALVSILAMGLEKYDQQKSAADEAITQQPAPIPTTPDSISEELKTEDTLTDADLDTEMKSEMNGLDQEDNYLQEVTQSYE